MDIELKKHAQGPVLANKGDSSFIPLSGPQDLQTVQGQPLENVGSGPGCDCGF